MENYVCSLRSAFLFFRVICIRSSISTLCIFPFAFNFTPFEFSGNSSAVCFAVATTFSPASFNFYSNEKSHDKVASPPSIYYYRAQTAMSFLQKWMVICMCIWWCREHNPRMLLNREFAKTIHIIIIITRQLNILLLGFGVPNEKKTFFSWKKTWNCWKKEIELE